MNGLHRNIKEALESLPPFKKVVVGLSGGMDSVALAHSLKALGYEVVVAHLNHQLRLDGADHDEQFAIDLAKKWELPFMTQKAVIPRKGNLEHNARAIRYAFLEEVREAYQADYIAVGHHFDDQIETILMHEKRGSGLRGKRGMSLVKGKVLRPMLEVPRADIESYIKEHSLDYVTDETNFDLTFERNHLRHKVIPKLKQDPEFEASIRRKAKAAREKLDSLRKEKDAWMAEYLKGAHFDRHAFNELSQDMKVEVLLELLGQDDVYSKTLGRLINFIEMGRTGKETLVKGMVFVNEYDQVRCVPESMRELPQKKLNDETNWGDYTIKVKDVKVLSVRPWKSGDKFRPTGMKGHKKLQDFFVDSKIPKHDRKQIPVIVDENDDIVCVGNLRFSEEHKHLKENIQIDEK